MPHDIILFDELNTCDKFVALNRKYGWGLLLACHEDGKRELKWLLG